MAAVIFGELILERNPDHNGQWLGVLLRQTSDLTHILMSLDQNDSRFNTLFADADFITAVLEASKEFGVRMRTTMASRSLVGSTGSVYFFPQHAAHRMIPFVLYVLCLSYKLNAYYKQESPGQVRVMDILHCFTTYEVGITALETVHGGITRAGVKYFKTLCHSLNLSCNCDVITVIIRILNHVFCRSLAVRIELMSLSNLAHCLLKTLVSVYRRLGMYNSIASAPSRRRTKDDVKTSADQLSSKLAAVPSPSWENLQSEDGRKSHRPEEASWSERAGAGEATSRTYRTPEASPHQTHKQKEMELSWSERRVASPLVKVTSAGDSESEWKRPAERRKKLKKKKGQGSTEDEKYGGEEEEGSGKSEKRDKDGEERDTMEENAEEEEGTNNSLASERLGGSSLPDSQEEQACSNIIDRRTCSTDSNVSEGFEPSQHATDSMNNISEHMDFDDKVIEDYRNETNETDADEKKTCQSRDNNKLTVKDSDWRRNDQRGKHSDNSSGTGCLPEKDEHKPNHFERSETGLFNHDDDENKDFSSVNVDRYQSLLDVLNEFLTDFFNSIRESLTTEEGEPILSETVTFLNTQCSSTSIRALVKCMTPDGEMSKPLSRLLDLTTHLKAFHLRHVILEFLPATEADKLAH